MTEYTIEQSPQEIPYGYCHCGCRQKTPIAKWTSMKRNCIKGQPTMFCRGHNPSRLWPARFWEKVAINEPDECWIWQASTLVAGYGKINFNGRRYLAHRMAYELCVGQIPNGLDVCHHCDTPNCVNPNHLFVGTVSDNMRDAIRKGRWQPAHGSCRPNAKLTEKQVSEMRIEYKGGGTSYGKLAAKYHVDRSTIIRIVARKKWQHV